MQIKLNAMPEKADTVLIRACKLWDKITEKMHDGEYDLPDELDHNENNRPYSEGDYKPLKCTITGKQAELTVGSSAGHRVKVDLEKQTLSYFDTDDEPNRVMNDLLEEAGLKCSVRSDRVDCEGLKKTNVDEVFKVLAMPTSMDFRLSHCKRNKVNPQEICEEDKDNTSFEDLGYKEPPSGCDCTEFWDDFVQNCVDNFDYSAYTSEDVDCNESEKNFFRNGPKKEELTKKEAEIIPKSQKKLGEF